MIPRYSRPEMVAIWDAENRTRIWLDIETHAAEAMGILGTVPKEVAIAMREKAVVDPAKIDAIEAITKHDVIAFLTNLAESIGPLARFVHQGMTSSDVVDTCFSMQLKQSSMLLLESMDGLLAALKRRAIETKHMLCIGRSHGIHAEPMVFGLKFASFYAEFIRQRQRLVRAMEEISVCAISGPVGTFASVDPFVQEYVAEKMGLTPEPVSTQVIPRDRHAMFFTTLAVIASSIERVATEVRHLQRTEVLEAEEYFSEGQKGSSAMPHKRNPILSENVTGLARMVRSYAMPAMENVALWHERDISHSSVERMIGPDATITLDFALHRLTSIIDRLRVYPERMQHNLDQLKGLVFSQRVLLALTQAGMGREEAYSLVQTHAMQCWRSGREFQALLSEDSAIQRYLDAPALAALFDYAHYTKHVDRIFEVLNGSR